MCASICLQHPLSLEENAGMGLYCQHPQSAQRCIKYAAGLRLTCALNSGPAAPAPLHAVNSKLLCRLSQRTPADMPRGRPASVRPPGKPCYTFQASARQTLQLPVRPLLLSCWGPERDRGQAFDAGSCCYAVHAPVLQGSHGDVCSCPAAHASRGRTPPGSRAHVAALLFMRLRGKDHTAMG
jgi:hypothetical protein